MHIDEFFSNYFALKEARRFYVGQSPPGRCGYVWKGRTYPDPVCAPGY